MPLEHHIAELDRSLAGLDAEMAAHEQALASARTDAASLATAIQTAAAAVTAAEAVRVQRAAEAAAAAADAAGAASHVAAAQGARDAAAGTVALHRQEEPEPPEPNSKGVIPAALMAAWRRRHKAWSDQLAVLLAAEQDTVNALGAAQGAFAQANARLEARNSALADASNGVAAAQGAVVAAQQAHAAALARAAGEEAELSSVRVQRAPVDAQREHYRSLSRLITGDPLDRAALEAAADELRAWLWRLRADRAGLSASRQANETQAAATATERAAAWERFRLLRVELDPEFGFERGQATPDACVQSLSAALAAADARVNTAAAELDKVAAKVAAHGAG